MCGIIAILRRPGAVAAADSAALNEALQEAAQSLSAAAPADRTAVLDATAARLEVVDRSLRGIAGVQALVADPGLVAGVRRATESVEATIAAIEDDVAHGRVALDEVEPLNAALLRLKDVNWMLASDRLRTADAVQEFLGGETDYSSVAAYLSIQQAMSAIDRMEVRGRDSAGFEVFVHNPSIDLASALVEAEVNERDFPLYTSRSVRVQDNSISFVYKAAAEIGELGDNTAWIRAQIAADGLLRAAVRGADAYTTVLGHTRWASIGVISEPNAHPQSSEEAGRSNPFVTAVLNGDVDNHADLASAEQLTYPSEISTDAKVIPTLMARRLAMGPAVAAFRDTVSPMEGSVAIAAHAAAEPDRLYLALRGSGQGLFVGLGEELFIVASEPYGVVEEANSYLRMDGETPANEANPTASQGQIIELSAPDAGSLAGISRWSYDGTELPVTDDSLATAEITTRDIDRGSFPHFLLKELSDAPQSFRKTLRGKLVQRGEAYAVELPEATLPKSVTDALSSGQVARIVVIGQGTAAVAGESLAYCLADLCRNTEVSVQAIPATELSGFHLRADMSDTLAVAISQSGTTTDTNRTVDIVRARGAHVVAIVNRRGSDLVDKSDGVLYTADGRDVEMSVASTKAFYSQIAAGLLLAYGIASHVEGAVHFTDEAEQAVLADLDRLPELMARTIERREECGVAARRLALSRRYWAIVGNGPNKIAAREIRIKLSELCYRSIACDSTEDKKHIDLSCEPMIIVCAAGLVGSTADDVKKEVAIFKAHKAAPIVVASEGAARFDAAAAQITVPDVHSRLAFVLSAMVGHLFGYEAALAIDAQARPLREARGVIDAVDPEATNPLAGVRDDLGSFAAPFFSELRSGNLNGNLEASTASKVASLWRFALGIAPLDAYELEFGRKGSPGVILNDLSVALSGAIDELTRPIDAIKHQAKTVTVGISRSDESVLQVPLVVELMNTGASRDRMSYATLRTLADLSPAVRRVTGYVRYSVTGASSDQPTAAIIDRGGIAAKLKSRVERDPRLRGTKHLVARELELMVVRGRSDGRTVVIVPESKDSEATGLVLLHVELEDRLDAATMRGVLSGYRRRYQALSDAVTETEDFLRDDLLADQPVVDLLVDPILDLAERWRTP